MAWREAWLEGIEHFNAGRYWHSHESWERGWTVLPEDLKNWIQGLIQACGSFHLFGIGRTDPAYRLAALARSRLAAVPEGSPARGVIAVPGLDAWLAAPSPEIPKLRAFPGWL